MNLKNKKDFDRIKEALAATHNRTHSTQKSQNQKNQKGGSING